MAKVRKNKNMTISNTAHAYQQGYVRGLREKDHELDKAVADERARVGGYITHQVHGEGGKTTDGRQLYWAKVSKAHLLSTLDKPLKVDKEL